MTKLGIFFYKSLCVAYRAAAVTLCIVYSIFCTSCLCDHLIRKQCIAMLQSSYFVRHIGVTAFAGVGGIALFGTSRICYNAGVLMLMSNRRNRDILGNVGNAYLDHRTDKLIIDDLCNAFIVNIYAAAENI